MYGVNFQKNGTAPKLVSISLSTKFILEAYFIHCSLWNLQMYESVYVNSLMGSRSDSVQNTESDIEIEAGILLADIYDV